MMKHKVILSIIKTEQRASVVENLEYISIPCVSIICVLRPRKTEGKRRERDRKKKLGEKIIKKRKHINKSKVIGILKERTQKKNPILEKVKKSPKSKPKSMHRRWYPIPISLALPHVSGPKDQISIPLPSLAKRRLKDESISKQNNFSLFLFHKKKKKKK